MSNQKSILLRLVESALMIALATVLSLIKLWTMPLGGAVTLLSMLPISLIALRYGIPWGLVTAVLYGGIQLLLDLGTVMSWGLSATVLCGSIAFDYLIGFGVLGLSGIFRKKGQQGRLCGISIAIFLRFVSSLVSGGVFFAEWMPENWSNAWLYSIAYNGAYMLPELILTVIGATALLAHPAVRSRILRESTVNS